MINFLERRNITGLDFFETGLNDIFKIFEYSPNINDSFNPNIEVIEKQSEYILKAEIPGIDKKEINISIEDNKIIIEGEKTIEKEENDEIYFKEISYGKFKREIRLPEDTDKEKIDATWSSGVLKICFPKKENDKKTKIKIK
jgi:HSP20 family protein